MFFEIEFEPDGHRWALKRIVAQDWKNDMHCICVKPNGLDDPEETNNSDDRYFVKFQFG